MTEPEYIYERGVGWFVKGAPTQVTFERFGKRITIIDRPPLIGEWGWDILGDNWSPDDDEKKLLQEGLWKPTTDKLLSFTYNISRNRDYFGWRNTTVAANGSNCYYVTIVTEFM